MKDWPQNEELNIDEFWNVYLNASFVIIKTTEYMHAKGIV